MQHFIVLLSSAELGKNGVTESSKMPSGVDLDDVIAEHASAADVPDDSLEQQCGYLASSESSDDVEEAHADRRH